MAKRVQRKAAPAIRKRRPVTGPGAVLSPRAVSIIERRYQVIALRRDGYNIREIATSLGCDEDAVRKDLISVLGQTVKDTADHADEYRALQDERLDQWLKEITPMTKWEEVDKPDPKDPKKTIRIKIPPNLAAVQTGLQIEARRAKLHALDKPETKIVGITGVREYIGVDLSQV